MDQKKVVEKRLNEIKLYKIQQPLAPIESRSTTLDAVNLEKDPPKRTIPSLDPHIPLTSTPTTYKITKMTTSSLHPQLSPINRLKSSGHPKEAVPLLYPQLPPIAPLKSCEKSKPTQFEVHCAQFDKDVIHSPKM